MKEEELDQWLKGSFQDKKQASDAGAANRQSGWILNKGLIKRWVIIAAFTLAAVAIVYMTGGVNELADMLQSATLKVMDWIRSLF